MMYDGEIERDAEPVSPENMTRADVLLSKVGREVSSIGFPYVDINEALAVARVFFERGGVPMDRDQLAAAMGTIPNHGVFNSKLAASRLFGLVEGAQGKFHLTPLGFDALDPTRAAAAMAQAFLNVPLYKRTYDEFKGRQLPPRPLGLESAFVSFGVAPKQKDKARWAFDKSARAAGFFASGNEDRLVQPVIGVPAVATHEDTAPAEEMRVVHPPEPARWDATPRPSIHPSIQGMVDDLLAP